MKKNTVVELTRPDQFSDSLTELLRTGAKQLLEQAVEAELAGFMEQFSGKKLSDGKTAVVRNGYQPERNIQIGIGPVTVKIPKVRAKDGDPVTFRSALVPPYVRKTASLEAALPWLYLKGVSTGEMATALEVLVGPEASGLSASTVSRLKQIWSEDYKTWCNKSLNKERWVYIWADGIYSGLRAENARLPPGNQGKSRQQMENDDYGAMVFPKDLPSDRQTDSGSDHQRKYCQAHEHPVQLQTTTVSVAPFAHRGLNIRDTLHADASNSDGSFGESNHAIGCRSGGPTERARW